MLAESILVNPMAARALLQNPHGRRMLCGALSLEGFLPTESSFFWGVSALDESASDDAARLLAGVQAHPETFHHVLQTPLCKNFSLDEGLMEMFLGVAKFSDWDAGSRRLRVSDLSNPFLDESAVARIYHASETSSVARLALIANPNMPANIKAAHPDPTIYGDYMVALAEYGDFSDGDTARHLAKAVAGQVFSASLNERIAINLLQRDSLPEEIVLALDDALAQRLHNRLVRKPYYREFVPSPQMTDAAKIITKRNVKLGLDMDAKALEHVYGLLETDVWRNKTVLADEGLAAAACHPNASAWLMRRALADGSVRAQLYKSPMLVKSPHAELAIREICSFPPGAMHDKRKDSSLMAGVKSCSADGLVWAFEQAVSEAREAGQGASPKKRTNLTPFFTHANFPWERYGVKDIVGKVPENHAAAALACMCMNAKLSSDSMDEILSGVHHRVALFSPAISAKRLESMAAKRPELAAWCAMHPNGGDVALPQGGATARVVADFRSKFYVAELPGRSGVAAEERVAILHL